MKTEVEEEDRTDPAKPQNAILRPNRHRRHRNGLLCPLNSRPQHPRNNCPRSQNSRMSNLRHSNAGHKRDPAGSPICPSLPSPAPSPDRNVPGGSYISTRKTRRSSATTPPPTDFGENGVVQRSPLRRSPGYHISPTNSPPPPHSTPARAWNPPSNSPWKDIPPQQP
ncbi:hypothetical protein BDQ17DRAFT_1327797 [Cyathus striatus]|nr:hypothetical protein BDQ17DRAFT_1327797 [Cyathus striatus]